MENSQVSSSPIMRGDKLAQRIKLLTQALSDGVYEREDTMRLCLLAALSGESVFLLGPPGIAKSLIAKRLIQAFESQSYFEYLMTRFSTPEEVFGPLSIQELKDNGRYLRLIDGYLPSAQVVFLDEIWKAGPAILNTLLTVINEKTFKNGQDILKVPMRLLISASNELPDKDSGLEALYDRMLIRVFVNRIQDKKNFRAMLTHGTNLEAQIPPELAVTDIEYQTWLQELDQIELTETIFEQMYWIKAQLEAIAEEESQDPEFLYVSDRRWKKAVKLLKASAYFNGRNYINSLDILLLQDCLWNSPQEKDIVSKVVTDFATQTAYQQQDISANIEKVLDPLNDISNHLVNDFVLKAQVDTQGTLRKKDVFSFDLSNAKRYQVGPKRDLVKLVILQQNQSVSEHETGDTRWVYVEANALNEAIAEGGGDVYGYVNRKTDLRKLSVSLNMENHLVMKDVGNRSIFVTLVRQNMPSMQNFPEWQTKVQSAATEVKRLVSQVRVAQDNFHQALPHNFISTKTSLAIETSLQSLNSKIDQGQTSCTEMLERLERLQEAFE